MKLYLDDIRNAPFGWDLVRTADACIERLSAGGVEELSLDHDLDEEHYGNSGYSTAPPTTYRTKTGYDVVKWMAEHNVWPQSIIVHTMNPAGRDAMCATIRRYAPHVTLEILPGFSRRTDADAAWLVAPLTDEERVACKRADREPGEPWE